MGADAVNRVLHVRTKLRPTESPAAVYAAMAKGVPSDVLLAFGPGIYRELRQELHSVEAVGQWAVALAIRLGQPVLLNVPDRDGSSHTLTLAPPGWSKERLAGYIAGRHAELEDVFGPIDRVQTTV